MPAAPPAQRIASGLALLAATVVFGQLAMVWAGRMPYPFDLEWMEGGMLGHAWQLQQGHPLYAPPSAEFVPFIYPPGYAALLAALGLPFGLSPALGRVISLAGSLAAAGALIFAVRHRSRDTVSGVLAAVTFLGTYAVTGAFFDLVRPDGLFLGLLGWAIALAFVPGRRAILGCAALLVGAFFVKHNAAFFGPALALGIGLRDGPRGGALFCMASLGPALVGIFILQLLTGGLFLTYLVEVPASHPLVWTRFFPRGPMELADALPLTSAATALVLLAQRHGTPHPTRWFGVPMIAGLLLAWTALSLGEAPASALVTGWGLTTLGAVAMVGCLHMLVGTRNWAFALGIGLGATALLSSLWMRAHSGGFVNVHLPALWIACLGAGLWLTGLPTRFAPFGRGAFAAQLVVQAWTFPNNLVPSRADYAAGEALVRTLEGLPGPVWSPDAVWLPTYAGHRPNAHRIGFWDLESHDGLSLDVSRVIRDRTFGAIITSKRPLGQDLDAWYRVRTKLHHNGALIPKTGWRVRLQAIRVPKRPL